MHLITICSSSFCPASSLHIYYGVFGMQNLGPNYNPANYSYTSLKNGSSKGHLKGILQIILISDFICYRLSETRE